MSKESNFCENRVTNPNQIDTSEFQYGEDQNLQKVLYSKRPGCKILARYNLQEAVCRLPETCQNDCPIYRFDMRELTYNNAHEDYNRRLDPNLPQNDYK